MTGEPARTASELRQAVSVALDAAHIPWTVDANVDRHAILAAGCYIALNDATGIPELWEIDSGSCVAAVAAALAGVAVDPRPAPLASLCGPRHVPLRHCSWRPRHR